MKSAILALVAIFGSVLSLQIAVDQNEEVWQKVLDFCKSQLVRAAIRHNPAEVDDLVSCMGLKKKSLEKGQYTTISLEDLKSGETCFNTPVCIRPEHKGR